MYDFENIFQSFVEGDIAPFTATCIPAYWSAPPDTSGQTWHICPKTACKTR